MPKNRKEKKVLIIGSGAREHAMVWKCQHSPQVKDVYISSPHCGVQKEYVWNFPLKGGTQEFHKIAEKAVLEKIDLVIVGPDNPLSEGIVDVLLSHHLTVFGPTQKAAQLEASKSFAKNLMNEAGIPTPQSFLCETIQMAEEKLKNLSWEKPWVLKADGLALGKGVVIANSFKEALECLDRLFSYEGGKILIEEFISGVELSWMAVSDGSFCSLLDPAQDYKRVFDGHQGPNTGGMGAYSPVDRFMNPELREYVRHNIFEKIQSIMKAKNNPFCGVFYAGLILDEKQNAAPGIPKIYVLEFNARFGDPEAQVLLPRMDVDFYALAHACATQALEQNFNKDIPFKNEKAVYVVAASQGYPENPKLDQEIYFHSLLGGPKTQENSNNYPDYFLGGVKESGEKWVTSGGRVLGALGMDLHWNDARQKAYQNLSKVSFQGMHFRKDIAAL